jgi:hypothetical protein
MATSLALALTAALPQVVLRLRRSCTSKFRFDTRRQAERMVCRALDGFKLKVYHCENCGGFHLTKRLSTML